jgi:L-amino acid N-acyltransferase YncA
MDASDPSAGVRDAVSSDAAACAAVYAPYVRDTAITFELEAPGAEQMEARIAASQSSHAWLVLEQDGAVAGYAYGSTWQSRPAYRFSCEVSVYVEMGRRRSGAGRALYEALFERLRSRGFRNAVAGMTVPNEASEGRHLAMGFRPVGTYTNIGYKLGAWHHVAYFQLELAETGIGISPSEPR